MNKQTRVIFEIDISRWPLRTREYMNGRKFTVARMVGKKALETIGMLDKDKTRFGYSWGDSFCIGIEVRKAKPRERVSNDFLGYEWMIKNIINHGSPYELSEAI